MKASTNIETARLLLRPFTEEDLDIIHALYSDPEIMRYTPFDPKTPEQSRAHLDQLIAEWKKEKPLNLEYAVILNMSFSLIALTDPARTPRAPKTYSTFCMPLA